MGRFKKTMPIAVLCLIMSAALAFGPSMAEAQIEGRMEGNLVIEDDGTTVGIDMNNTHASDGDPRIRFLLNDTAKFSLGVDDSDSDKLKLGTTGIDTSTRLTVDGNGRLGIGTTIPEQMLHVVSTSDHVARFQASSAPYIYFDNSSGYENSISMDSEGKIYIGGGGTARSVRLRTGWTARLTVDPDGLVGIGTTVPAEQLDINGAIRLRDMGGTGGGNGYSVLFSQDVSGVSQLYGGDEQQFAWQLSSHRDPRDVNPSADSSFMDLDIPLPFSFHHYNRLIGKGAVVDMAAMVKEFESLTGKSFTYPYELSPEQVLDYPAWQASEQERMEIEARQNIIETTPEVEIAIGDAWEEREIMEEVVSASPVVRYRYDLDSEEVIEYVDTIPAVQLAGTGVYRRVLKPGVRFDESTGKFFRRRTLEEIEIDPIAPPELPDWIVARLPQGER